MRPDVFVEESRRAMQTASQKPEQTDPGPDILAERPARGQLDAQVQEQNMEQEQPLPKQLPPLNLDELRRDSMPLVVPNQPREELHAEPEEAEATQQEPGFRTGAQRPYAAPVRARADFSGAGCRKQQTACTGRGKTCADSAGNP